MGGSLYSQFRLPRKTPIYGHDGDLVDSLTYANTVVFIFEKKSHHETPIFVWVGEGFMASTAS